MNTIDTMTEAEMRELVRLDDQLQLLSLRKMNLDSLGLPMTPGDKDALDWYLREMDGKHYLADLARSELARLDYNRQHPGKEVDEQRRAA